MYPAIITEKDAVFYIEFSDLKSCKLSDESMEKALEMGKKILGYNIAKLDILGKEIKKQVKF